MRLKILKTLKIMERSFPEIDFNYKVNFNLISKIDLGIYSPSNDIIYFNLPIANNSGFQEYIKIIIHEFSHMIATYKYGKDIKPHGLEWINIMKKLKAPVISEEIDFNKYI